MAQYFSISFYTQWSHNKTKNIHNNIQNITNVYDGQDYVCTNTSNRSGVSICGPLQQLNKRLKHGACAI